MLISRRIASSETYECHPFSASTGMFFLTKPSPTGTPKLPVSSLFPAIHIFLLTAQAQRLFQGSLPSKKTPSIAKRVAEESVF